MKHAITLGGLCLCCLAALAGTASQPTTTKPADKLVFRNCGFAISPLDQPGKGTNQLLFMLLPVSDGFAANVGVQTQTYSGTLDEYVDLSQKQFKEGKLDVVSTSKPDKDTAVFEYSGQMQGKALHFYAKAALRDGTIYLATATAAQDHWKDVSEKLKSCVDSFQLLQRQSHPE